MMICTLQYRLVVSQEYQDTPHLNQGQGQGQKQGQDQSGLSAKYPRNENEGTKEDESRTKGILGSFNVCCIDFVMLGWIVGCRHGILDLAQYKEANSTTRNKARHTPRLIAIELTLKLWASNKRYIANKTRPTKIQMPIRWPMSFPSRKESQMPLCCTLARFALFLSMSAGWVEGVQRRLGGHTLGADRSLSTKIEKFNKYQYLQFPRRPVPPLCAPR